MCLFIQRVVCALNIYRLAANSLLCFGLHLSRPSTEVHPFFFLNHEPTEQLLTFTYYSPNRVCQWPGGFDNWLQSGRNRWCSCPRILPQGRACVCYHEGLVQDSKPWSEGPDTLPLDMTSEDSIQSARSQNLKLSTNLPLKIPHCGNGWVSLSSMFRTLLSDW